MLSRQKLLHAFNRQRVLMMILFLAMAVAFIATPAMSAPMTVTPTLRVPVTVQNVPTIGTPTWLLDNRGRVGITHIPVNAYVTFRLPQPLSHILFQWMSSGNYDYTTIQFGGPSSYDIQVSSNSTDGSNGNWTTVESIRGNTVAARSHVIKSPNIQWVRFRVGAGNGNVDEIDIHDLSQTQEGVAMDTWGFIGDSITAFAFWRDAAAGKPFNVWVNESIPGRYPSMVNFGVGGQNAQHIVNRLQNTIDMNPGVHFYAIGIGTNGSNSESQFRSQLIEMINILQRNGKQAIIARIPATRSGSMDSRIQQYNAVIDDLTRIYDLPAGPDLYTAFTNNPTYFRDDLHPSNIGIEVMNRLWAEAACNLATGGVNNVTVSYGVSGGNGSLAARVGTTNLANGGSVASGTNVSFIATPNAGYRVREWRVNNIVVAGLTTTMHSVVASGAALNVSVSFEPTSGTTNFRVSGSKILNPDGTEFLIKGININGPGWCFQRDTLQDVGLLLDAWKFNAVRLCAANKWDSFAANWNRDLNAIVKAFTDRGIVVILENHDYTGTYPSLDESGGYDNQGNYLLPLSHLKTWWIDKGQRFGNNPYVWFNIMNEPGSSANQTSSNLWLQIHDELIRDIRNTGAENIIVLDEHAWGQGNGYYGGASSYDSAIMRNGQTLNGRYSNLVYSLHVYESWADGLSRFNRYFQDAADRGLCIIIGEFGVIRNNVGQQNAVRNMYNSVIPNNIGRMYWAWDDNNLPMTTDGRGWQINRTDGITTPTNLTWVGDLVWRDNRGLLTAPIETNPGGPLLINGDFEDGMTGWQDWGRSSVINGAGYNGTRALRVTSGGTGGAGQMLELKPNTTYRISAWGRNDPTASPATDIGVKYRLADNDPNEFHNMISFTENYWIQKSLTFRTQNQLFGSQFFIWKPDTRVTFYIDDVELVEVGATNHVVTFSVSGANGSIRATVNNAAITSGASVAQGSNVVFTATPNTGYRVREWRLNNAVVSGNTSNTYTLSNLSAAATVTVAFEQIPVTHRVTFSVSGANGSIRATVNGATITSGASVAQGSNVVFTATPNTGYRVREWRLNNAVVSGNTSNSYTLSNLAAAATVTVAFELIPVTYRVTFSVSGANGSIRATVNNAAITSGASVARGSNVVFTATPNTGYRVREWRLNNAVVSGNTSNSYTLSNLSAAATVTVAFELIPVTYRVTFSVSGANGSIRATVNNAAITSGASVAQGANVVFTATPNTGYRVREWRLNNAVVSGNTSNTYTLSNLSAAATVTVAFELIPTTNDDITNKFTDPAFLAVVRSAVGKSTGPIYKSDVERITSLNASNRNIASLAGIEYFTNLQTLNCSNNRLATLNLTNNTKLTSLTCNTNQLTTLDLSKNVALAILTCSYNRLTALNLSANVALTNLDCGYNQLTSLDVSNNTRLSWLDCKSNRLTRLDVSRITRLSTLDCRNNNIRSINDVIGVQATTNFYFNPQN